MPKVEQMLCIWFREDLRIDDNTALIKAQRDNPNTPIIALYTLTPKTWLEHAWSDIKVNFLLKNLLPLSKRLREFNIPLKIINTTDFLSTPSKILTFCQKHNILSIYANRQTLLDEAKRDKKTASLLKEAEINFHLTHDSTILLLEDTVKKDGTPFKVFTPFKRNWLKKAGPENYYPDKQQLKKQKKLSIDPDPIPASLQGFNVDGKPPELWPAGEKAAHKHLALFCDERMSHYEKNRNFSAMDATSQISPYLSIGVLSARQCIDALLEASGAHDLTHACNIVGTGTWLSQVIWRDFYHAIAFHYPTVVKQKPFKLLTEHLKWSKNQSHFKAWCAGQTGFPFVDAGMRQLNQLGWMHNRLRMVTAMFLTKTLFIHWRWGEDYFSKHLIDTDFASNNGGWQWSASTGTDAAPYFRIFNPITQGQRFDPDGDFIRTYCPELKNCSNKEIHNPSPETRKQANYPSPVVNYSLMRVKVIKAFKELKSAE